MDRSTLVVISDLSGFDEGDEVLRAWVNGAQHLDDRFVNVIFENCLFTACVFQMTSFVSCEFLDCIFEGCDLSGVRLDSSRLGGCRFVECKLTGVDWTRPDWRALTMYGPLQFEQCRLAESFAAGVPWAKVHFTDSNLTLVDFGGADLSGARFDGTDLHGARFDRATLDGADLSGARNYLIDVRATSVADAAFSLPHAVGLLEALPIRLIEPPP